MQTVTRRRILKAVLAAPLCWSACRASEDLSELGARDLPRRIRQGDVKAEVYFAALIARWREHASLNGIASIDAIRMLEVGRELDRARSHGVKMGCAAGVAVAVKDQIAVAGYPAASGNPALQGYRPRRHAAVVAALVAAGAVPFAKTTCPNMTGNSSLMQQVESYSPAYGVVRNPYDPTRMAGGSSGGSGVVLAARIVPAALGEDTNGSIRVPAAFCGVAGLRPSTYTIENALAGTARKRYSDDGLIIGATRLDTIGPMARTVADVAFLDEIVTGERTPVIAAKAARIAIPRADYWEQDWVDPRVADVVLAAFVKLRESGAHLIEIDYLSLRSSVGELGRFSDMALAAQELNAPAPDADSTATWLSANLPTVSLDQFNGRPASTQARGFWRQLGLSTEEQRKLLFEYAKKYEEIFRANDVMAIAAPTTPVLPQRLGVAGPTDFETIKIRGKAFDRGSVIITQSVVAPRYGAPALSLPAGLAAGLPVGLELAGLPGRDSEVLGLGIMTEAVLGRIHAPRSTMIMGD